MVLYFVSFRWGTDSSLVGWGNLRIVLNKINKKNINKSLRLMETQAKAAIKYEAIKKGMKLDGKFNIVIMNFQEIK